LRPGGIADPDHQDANRMEAAMNHDDELFWRAVAHWRECDGRYVPPALMNLAMARARIARAHAARDLFRGLVGRRTGRARKRRAAQMNANPGIRHA
jgi:hypothetical protein